MSQEIDHVGSRTVGDGGISVLKKLLFALVILNMADMALILWGMHMGVLEEVNPLMRWCIDRGTPFFSLVKLGLCAGYVLVALWARKPRYIGRITSVVVAIYLIVVVRTIGLFLVYY